MLVPVDGSPTSNQGLDEAVKLAKLTGARLRLIHVINELAFSAGIEIYTADVIGLLNETGAQILASAKARVEAAGVDAVTRLSENFGRRLCDIVVDDALEWDADLIVIGSHGRRGVARLFIGSDAEQICASPRCRCCWFAQSRRNLALRPRKPAPRPQSRRAPHLPIRAGKRSLPSARARRVDAGGASLSGMASTAFKESLQLLRTKRCGTFCFRQPACRTSAPVPIRWHSRCCC